MLKHVPKTCTFFIWGFTASSDVLNHNHDNISSFVSWNFEEKNTFILLPMCTRAQSWYCCYGFHAVSIFPVRLPNSPCIVCQYIVALTFQLGAISKFNKHTPALLPKWLPNSSEGCNDFILMNCIYSWWTIHFSPTRKHPPLSFSQLLGCHTMPELIGKGLTKHISLSNSLCLGQGNMEGQGLLECRFNSTPYLHWVQPCLSAPYAFNGSYCYMMESTDRE